MGTPYLGEIRMVAFSFAPKGWAMCNGQTMPINQNQALFSLLGTTFGGDGRTTFQLPDFRGRTAIEAGTLGNTTYNWGQSGGEELHVLAQTEMAPHTHTAMASSASATTANPAGSFWATGVNQYSASPPSTPMAGNAIAPAGGGQGHENRSPLPGS
ncbi:MAG: tail fiber protein [Candidatus Sulfotelmatobacter sp.]|jgi:microcystin-dependent protein